MKYITYSAKTAQKVIHDMLTGAVLGDRECLRYTFTDDAGRVCALDGFRAFRVAAPVEGLPVMPEGLTPVDLARIWPDRNGMKPLEKPDLTELDALISYDRKHAKAPGRYMFKFGKGLPVVNASYLRDALRVYPDARLFYKDNFTPVLVLSEYGDGVVLPCRVSDEQRERRTVIYSLSTFAARFAA